MLELSVALAGPAVSRRINYRSLLSKRPYHNLAPLPVAFRDPCLQSELTHPESECARRRAAMLRVRVE